MVFLESFSWNSICELSSQQQSTNLQLNKSKTEALVPMLFIGVGSIAVLGGIVLETNLIQNHSTVSASPDLITPPPFGSRHTLATSIAPRRSIPMFWLKLAAATLRAVLSQPTI
jgi:hypothetical protein